jgi:hypothetical protein
VQQSLLKLALLLKLTRLRTAIFLPAQGFYRALLSLVMSLESVVAYAEKTDFPHRLLIFLRLNATDILIATKINMDNQLQW